MAGFGGRSSQSGRHRSFGILLESISDSSDTQPLSHITRWDSDLLSPSIVTFVASSYQRIHSLLVYSFYLHHLVYISRLSGSNTHIQKLITWYNICLSDVCRETK